MRRTRAQMLNTEAVKRKMWGGRLPSGKPGDEGHVWGRLSPTAAAAGLTLEEVQAVERERDRVFHGAVDAGFDEVDLSDLRRAG